MLCNMDQDRSRVFLEKFGKKTFHDRTPLIGTIELTSRCNLNCVHCYVGKKRSIKDGEHPAGQWMDWIDQFADAGCLFLLFTGGETLLRSDFHEIYAHACRRGMLVTVFTNGTLVSEKVMDVFGAYPPHCIEITLYGATADTYEKITGVPGSFKKCMRGIHRIKNAGFNLKLKTMLLSLNQHELADMQAIASGLNASFRYDAAISPGLDGDPAPLQYRVSAATVAEKESVDRGKMMEWRDLYRRFKDLKTAGKLYDCGAGMTSFHVDSKGIPRPCFMVPGAKYDLTRNDFHDMWHDNHFLDFQRPGDMPPVCGKCDHKVLCGYCPGFFKLETGDERTPSDYLCRIGGYRRKTILSFNAEEKINENGSNPSREKRLSKTGTDGY